MTGVKNRQRMNHINQIVKKNKKLKLCLVIIGSILFILTLFSIGFINIDRQYRKALPLSIVNNSNCNWCLIFLPYMRENIKSGQTQIYLPPIVSQISKNKSSRQFCLITLNSEVIDLYFGKNIDFSQFYLIIMGWKLSNEEIITDNTIMHLMERKSDLLVVLHNENFIGEWEKDNYEPFAVVTLK